jgi:hypothetical protein
VRIAGVPILLPTDQEPVLIKDTHRLIGAACGNKLPDSDHISCVSINWPVEGLVPVTIRRAQRRFRSRLTRIQRTTASSTSFILHPNCSRADLELALKRRFPIRAAWPRQNDSGFTARRLGTRHCELARRPRRTVEIDSKGQ